MIDSQRLILISASLVLAWGPITSVSADEVFICGGDKVVRVALDKLADMKRTNACVAAHYGLEIKPTPVAQPQDSEGVLRRLLSKPVRAKRPPAKEHKAAKSTAGPERTAKSKPSAAAKKKATKSAKVQDLPVKVYKSGDALPVEEIAAKPSDYRNVRVLNGKTPTTRMHRHLY